MGPM